MEKSNPQEKTEWDHEAIIAAEESTQARKKLKAYFLEISRTDWFQKKIAAIREKYGIPAMGYFPSPDGSRHFPPEQLANQPEADRKILDEIGEICKKYSLHYLDWFGAIQDYLYYNRIDEIFEPNAQSLIYLADLANEREEPFSEYIQKDDAEHYPIALRLSPYVTERDILDYVRKTYKPFILPILKQYRKSGVKIGKVKEKNQKIMERNQFIYENRLLPRKEIMRMVSKKFGRMLDYGHIGKIISLESQKRKDVGT